MPNVNREFVGAYHQQQRKAIRAFCEQAAGGGMLLVTGVRGSGKTRLVDEALNVRNCPNRPSLMQQFFGDISNSRRKSLPRQPRGVSRTLIPIAVDAVFPYPELGADKTDTTALTVEFIRNIVFGLTCAIDCRYSCRKHGKTLRDKLGFWRYWFDPNAMPWKDSKLPEHNKYIYTMLVILACTMVFIFLTVSKLYNSWIALLAALLPLLVCIMAWLLLRWWDLMSLDRMSGKLYSLVNGVRTSDSLHVNQEQKNEWISKVPWLIIASLPLLWAIDISFFGSSYSKLLKNDWVPLAAGATFLTFTATRLFVRQEDHLEEYGKDNPVWMINLLRRYLYLCHRCGLEPVLVVDELDKLEMLDTWWKDKHKEPSESKSEADPNAGAKSKAEAGSPDTQSHININATTESHADPNKLDQFLLMLCRLKASLGAEFLWILIGGPAVLTRLQQDRHARDDGTLGRLATTIRQEIVVGPMSLQDAQGLIDFSGSSLTFREQKFFTKALWLRCRGNFASMVREIERDWHFNQLSPEFTKLTTLVAIFIALIWKTEDQSTRIGLANLSSPVLEEKLFDPSAQIWIRSGMLEAANRMLAQDILRNNLVTKLIPKKLADEIDKEQPLDILKVLFFLELETRYINEPEVLRELGKRYLYSYLNSDQHNRPDKLGINLDATTGRIKLRIRRPAGPKGKPITR